MRRILGRRTAAVLSALVVACVAGIAASIEGTGEADPEVTVFRTGSASRVPVLRARPRDAAPDGAVAVLVHGFQCNKSMMAQLAKDLALNGVDAYAVDLPGHGASAVGFSEERAHDVTMEALDWIVAQRRLDRSRIALIGHSYGAQVVGRIAAEDGRYSTTILVGPAYGGGFSPSRPQNLLLLTAEREPPRIAAFAREIARDATGGAADRPFAGTGEWARGDVRRWAEIASADHLSVLFSPDARREMIAWIDRAMRRPHREVRLASLGAPLALSVLALAAALGASALACRASRGALASPPVAPATSALRPTVVAIVAVALALLATRVVVPLRFLRIAEGDVLASVLFIAGVIATATAVLVCRERLPTPAQVARGVPVAALAAMLLHFVAAPVASGAFYHLSVADAPIERVTSTAIVAICIFPFFAFIEAVLDGVRRSYGNGVLAHVRAIALAVPFFAALAWSLGLASPTLGRFAAAVTVAMTCCAAIAGILSASAANFAAGAAFSATATAWIVAVGFARY